MGFTLNKYDPCVPIMVINKKQCTVTWYVDDSKMSHVDSNVVTEVIRETEKEFGKMTVTRGKKHAFVGMGIEFNQDRLISITMQEFLKECIQTFGENFNGGASALAKTDLFEIDKDIIDLDEDKRDILHHIVAKVLFVSKRAPTE